MGTLRYLLCLALLVPVTGYTAFVLFTEAWNRFGFSAVTDRVFATVFDPVGEGIWGVGLVIAGGILLAAGFSDSARPVAFAALATFGTAFTVFLGVALVRAGQFDWPLLLFLVPTVPGIVLSAKFAWQSPWRETIPGPSAPKQV
jgi:hypothetical protein